ncbi:MAG: DUF3726 domain-containing protein [Litoreibacter sp.]|uniref:DUF3726 domain-containing protein n=1 Tax=Litoreibacter sp. TaxID=1969459 RepID=UPI0032978515
MSNSLNEIDALVKRATRGAGLSWGMAEEAGKAVRWLASHQFSGATALANLLDEIDGREMRELAPASLEGSWAAPKGMLCPLASGAALNDCASKLVEGAAIEMTNVCQPMLMAPFAAWAALQIGAVVEVAWQDMCLQSDGYSLWVGDPKGQVGATSADALSCRRVTGRSEYLKPPAHRRQVDATTWARLNVYAQRTYAPATEASRMLGAGAGVSDND